MLQSIKTEPFDCIQSFYTKVQEHVIRAEISFNSRINEQALTKAVEKIVIEVPQYLCSFDLDKHSFEFKNYTSNDIIEVVDSNDNSKIFYPDIENEPLLKIFIIKNVDFDSIEIVSSHIVCDGGGFKELLYLLASYYTSFKKGETPKEIHLERNFNNLFSEFDDLEEKAITSAPTIPCKQTPEIYFPLEGDKNNSFIERIMFTQSETKRIKDFSKKHNSTMNDIIMSAYSRVIARKLGITSVSLPCPTDLRLVAKRPELTTIANFTGGYSTSIDINKGESFIDTLEKISNQMNSQKEGFGTFKGPIKLHKVYKFTPKSLVEKDFRKNSPIAVTSYTNLGILNKDKLKFEGLEITDAYLVTSGKKAPYYQLAVSTYDSCLSFSSAFFGTLNDRQYIKNLFNEIHQELINNSI